MEIGPLASVVAAMASCATLWISWRVYRRQTKGDLPVVSADVEHRGGPWWIVKISLKNRSPVEWTADEITIRTPKGGRVTRAAVLERSNAEQPWKIEATPPPDPETLATSLRLNLKAFPAGAKGDHRGASVLVWVPSSGGMSTHSIGLSMRLSLSSIDAERRSIAIDINRTLTEVSKTAT